MVEAHALTTKWFVDQKMKNMSDRMGGANDHIPDIKEKVST